MKALLKNKAFFVELKLASEGNKKQSKKSFKSDICELDEADKPRILRTIQRNRASLHAIIWK